MDHFLTETIRRRDVALTEGDVNEAREAVIEYLNVDDDSEVDADILFSRKVD